MVEKFHTAGFWPNLYEPFRQVGQKVADWFAPRADASALQDYYEINLELPGTRIEDVEVSVHDNSLVVHGEKAFEHQETGRTYFFSEREFGSFQRTFRLPADADSGKVDADFKDGVLCIRIAKRAASQPQGKKIEVRRA